VYHQGKKYVLFVYLSHKILMFNVYDLSEALFCTNTGMGSIKPSWDQLCIHVDRPYPSYPSPSPLSLDWSMVRTGPPLSLSLSFGWHVGLFKLSPEHCFISPQNRCHMDL
jgi:hypothetical protein